MEADDFESQGDGKDTPNNLRSDCYTRFQALSQNRFHGPLSSKKARLRLGALALVLLLVLLWGPSYSNETKYSRKLARNLQSRHDLNDGASSPWASPSSGWAFGLGSYARDSSADVQYKRIISRLERLTLAVGEKVSLLRDRDAAAAGIKGDSLVDADTFAQAAAQDRERIASVARAAAALVPDSIDAGDPESSWLRSAVLPYVPQPVGARYFITYGDSHFNKSKARIAAEAGRFGVFDAVRAWGPEDLSLAFVQRNYAILSAQRGGGYWLWKPFIIAETLAAMEDGDVLMYADAGCTFLSDPTPYIELAGRYGMVAFRVPHSQAQYTKGIVFKALGMDVGMWGSELQVIAGILVIQKRPFTTFLVSEWLRLCQDESLITDADTSTLAPNHKSFTDHRHDQSIWSLLVHKHGAQLVLQQRHFPPETARIIAATRRVG